MKNISAILVALFFLSVAPLASAQTPSTTTSAALQPLKTRLLEHQQNREDLRKLMQEKKEAAQAKNQAEREQFRLKLQSLSDQRKKVIVERIDLKLSTINQNATQRLSLAIEKLEKLLDKFSQKAEVASTAGQDTNEVNTAIGAAELAINEAKDAVATQAARTYTADITSEPGLKNIVGEEVSTLRRDLKLTHDVVRNAKQKVMDVARAVAKLRSMEKTSTPSATVSPSVTVAPSI